jgi:glucan phosphoethanolaminetransferase (alkaline phosphatase superfamily)
MFMAFAFLQLNDPDPILWILIYGAMAAVSVMAIFEYYIPRLMWAMAAGYIVYVVILFPGVMEWYNSPDRSLLFDDLAKMQYLYIEEAREFLGLIICLVVLGFYLFRASRLKKA